MARSTAETPAAYLDELPPDRRAEIAAARALIAEAAPSAEEAVRWGMLSWHVGDRPLVALAAQKRHLSLYLLEACTDPDVLDPVRERLGDLDMGKGCIRFAAAAELPQDALREVIAAGADAAARAEPPPTRP